MAPYCFCVESLSRILSGPRDLTWEPVVDEAGGWSYCSFPPRWGFEFNFLKQFPAKMRWCRIQLLGKIDRAGTRIRSEAKAKPKIGT